MRTPSHEFGGEPAGVVQLSCAKNGWGAQRSIVGKVRGARRVGAPATTLLTIAGSAVATTAADPAQMGRSRAAQRSAFLLVHSVARRATECTNMPSHTTSRTPPTLRSQRNPDPPGNR